MEALPILKYPSGKSGYNKKIKQLLKEAGIDRKVTEFDEVEGVNKYVPICETSSSKLARSTHVDMMNKVQINIYAAGLHRRGSSAVTHYTMLELADRFKLMNLAFDQEDYRVDKKLEVFDSSVENMSALAFRTSLKSALKQDSLRRSTSRTAQGSRW